MPNSDVTGLLVAWSNGEEGADPSKTYNQAMGQRVAVFTGVVLLSVLAGAQEQAPNRREFNILAKDHTFTPNRIEVTQDDLVKITLKSEDRPSSFAIDAYRLIKRAGGGLTITFEFRADKPGTFPFYCNLTSDKDCKDMKGTLVVKPK